MAAFGGALQYSEHGFLARLVMRCAAADVTGDTDASWDYEYTNWDKIESFVASFVEYAEPTAGIATEGAAVWTGGLARRE